MVLLFSSFVVLYMGISPCYIPDNAPGSVLKPELQDVQCCWVLAPVTIHQIYPSTNNGTVRLFSSFVAL